MDVLFLYRTPKKKRYFSSLKSQSLKNENVKVVGYYSLIFNLGFLSPLNPKLKPALQRSIDEVFRSREFFGSSFFKFFFKFIISIKIKCLHKGLNIFFKKNSPKKVVVWNGLKHPDWILKEVLKDHPNVETLFMENGFLPNTTFLDSKGVNAGSSLSEKGDFYLNKELKDFPEYHEIKGRSSVKKSEKEAEYQAPLQNYLLLAFQMERDSQILDYSSWIKNMTQLFNEVKKARKKSALSKNPMVVREHPSTKVRYPELYNKKTEFLHFDHQTPFQEALKKASVIVTVNSSVGFEGILMNKTVIALGDAFYALEGLCLKANNPGELVQALNESSSFSLDQNLKRHFLSYLYNDFLVQGDWKNPSKEHFDSFKERFNTL